MLSTLPPRDVERSGFRRRFEQKGRLHDYLARIPTYTITAEFPGLLGVGALLRAVDTV